MHPLTEIRQSDRKAGPLLDDPADDALVWDVLDPFAPPDSDPTEARLRTLIQAEIAHMRRYEDIGPLDPLPGEEDSDSDHESHPDDDADADDEDEDEDEEDMSRPIALPRLLHTRPLCYITAPPSPLPSSSSSSSGEDEAAPWLAHTYPDISEAEEQARKARRDAHRSRLKALAILGPEAAAAIHASMPHPTYETDY